MANKSVSSARDERAHSKSETTSSSSSATEAALTESQASSAMTNKEWLNTLYNSLIDAVLVTDLRGTIIEVNQAVTAMFGYEYQELVGCNVGILMPAAMAGQHEQLMQRALDYTEGKNYVIGKTRELEAERKNGSRFPITIHLSKVAWGAEHRYIATLRDISEERKAAETIETLSLFDRNTGLPNRTHFLKLVAHILKEQSIKVVAVNMDFFNRVNIVAGPDEGNQILRVIARRLEHFVASFGGFVGKDIEDRFWLAVPVSGNSAGEFRHDRSKALLALLRQEVIVHGRSYYFTGSIGLARADRGNEASQVIANAETAVHEAKANGRDQYSEYKRVMTAQVVDDFRREEQLRHAIEKGHLECWLQSKVDANQRWVAAEALVRWRHYEEWIPPNKFIPLAERLGLIVPIGQFMLESVARILPRARALFPNFEIAVNVSPRQFRSEHFAENVIRTFQRLNAPLEGLKLEITESLLVDDSDQVQQTMERLKAHGVTFSIDDFGTGYSNLRRLQWMPVGEVKIDRAFVHAGMQSERERALLDTIVTMGANLSLERVAEGIETIEQFEYLRELGCQQFQGFYFHRPEPALDWLKKLSEQK